MAATIPVVLKRNRPGGSVLVLDSKVCLVRVQVLEIVGVWITEGQNRQRNRRLAGRKVILVDPYRRGIRRRIEALLVRQVGERRWQAGQTSCERIGGIQCVGDVLPCARV